ncbi:MAG: peptidase S10 [Maricaulis sp.]|nr:peptidase S10 [Maricaulis sp.]
MSTVLLNRPLAALTLAAALALPGLTAAQALEPAILNSQTRHEGEFGGETVSYQALVERTALPASDETPAVEMVSFAYLRDPAPQTGERPVIFLFNGGPGAASSWLHMGAMGPVRINAPLDPASPVPDGQAPVANPHSLIDVADLVFLDPPGTGFSRVAEGSEPGALYSFNGDAEIFVRFIETWLADHDRTDAPVFVLGESYGTMRAAAIAGLMAERSPLDGVILMGQAVNMIETSQRRGNMLSYATNLSTLAGIAAYHDQVDTEGQSIPDFIDTVQDWAMGDYLAALLRRNQLSADERTAVAVQLEAYTGLPADTYLANGLIFSKMRALGTLLADEGRVMAMYDARYTAPAPQPGGGYVDPYGAVSALVPAALATHFSDTLGLDLPFETYVAIDRNASPNWTYDRTGGMGGPFDDYYYTGMLEAAFAANPDFRLMIGTGRYDLTTTLGPARYLADQIQAGGGHVETHEYEGGHMAYTNPEALEVFSGDLRAFIAEPN